MIERPSSTSLAMSEENVIENLLEGYLEECERSVGR